MKPAAGSLIALLNGNTSFRMADLLTVSFWDGSFLRLTNADLDLVSGGNTFQSGSDQDAAEPTFKRGTTRCVVGIEVDTLDLTLYCGQTVKVGGIALVKAAANGIFDGARIKLERVFMPSWGDTSAGTVILFEGRVATVEPSSTEIRISVKSELETLNVAMPRNVFMPACSHVLYGTGCGVLKASYQVTGTVSAGATTTSVPSSRTEANDYFRLGVITFTSGQNTGARRSVRAYANASGLFTLSTPLPYAPVPGDTFTVFPGCDHTQATCNSKFANLTRFRGFPFVPRPETAR